MKIFLIFVTIFSKVLSQFGQQPNGFVENICFCVTSGYCSYSSGNNSTSPPETTPGGDENNGMTTKKSNRKEIEEDDGTLELRIRIGVSGQQPAHSGNTMSSNIAPVWVGVKMGAPNTTSCNSGLDVCCPKTGYGCGIRYPPVSSAASPNGIGQSAYGAYPWMVDLRLPTNEFLGAGALIHHRHVLTVAHKVYFHASIKCLVGQWSRGNDHHVFPIQEFTVPEENIAIHPNFTSMKTLINDIAILRLKAPGVILGLHPAVTTICLPSQPVAIQRCWVAGWGKGEYNSSFPYQMIMREVNVPLVSNDDCQHSLRQTRLGSDYKLDSSFICAGGEAGNDACLGDGGGPLACSVNGRFYVTGLVAWGIGCGTAQIPGVYVNVQMFTSWIQATIKQLAENESKAASTVKQNFQITTKFPPFSKSGK